jgi:hypothetical protein
LTSKLPSIIYLLILQYGQTNTSHRKKLRNCLDGHQEMFTKIIH